jgi:hypothetical protein
MWFRSVLAKWGSAARPRQPRARSSRRLAREQLEDRLVPATFNASSVSDLIADINAGGGRPGRGRCRRRA